MDGLGAISRKPGYTEGSAVTPNGIAAARARAKVDRG